MNVLRVSEQWPFIDQGCKSEVSVFRMENNPKPEFRVQKWKFPNGNGAQIDKITKQYVI